jgi:hypothetical protein
MPYRAPKAYFQPKCIETSNKKAILHHRMVVGIKIRHVMDDPLPALHVVRKHPLTMGEGYDLGTQPNRISMNGCSPLTQKRDRNQ